METKQYMHEEYIEGSATKRNCIRDLKCLDLAIYVDLQILHRLDF